MWIALLCSISLVATGCSQAAPQSAVDCPDQIRAEAAVYTWHGSAEQHATAHATADLAECDDAGEDPQGSVFPADPAQVRTWTFDGHPSAKVLGVANPDGSFGVFIADSVTPDERERIVLDLSGG